VDKDELARRVAAERGIGGGPVCAISSLEPSPTFERRGTHIIRRMRPCGVLHQYQIHPEVGWMYARVQTWFPFNIQARLNGRAGVPSEPAGDTPGCSHHRTNQRSSTESVAASGMTRIVAPRKETELLQHSL